MIRILVSRHCPDCPPMMELLETAKFEYDLIDITDSMKNLKYYLKLRDECEFFKKKKEEGLVGIPSAEIDGEVFDFTEELFFKLQKRS